jgi:YbbR domain-containing protein
LQKSPIPTLRNIVFENVLWFVGSVLLATLVWMIAVSQNDPVEAVWFESRVPIRALPDEGLIITSQSETLAAVQIRAQRSVQDAIEDDDIVVTADLSGLMPGTHVVRLEGESARQAAVTDTRPRQITISLEIEESQLKPVEAVITAEPPLDYRRSEPELSVPQVTVSGPLSRVQQVDVVRVSLDLTEQRNTFEDDARLTPIDVDGNVVEGVTLDTQVISVRVEIESRDDVKPMSVLAIPEGDLPAGYILNSFDYEPQSVYVSGTPGVLERIGDTLFTEPIDFTGRTSDFEITVPILLPDQSLVLLSQQDVTVRVGIVAQTATRQLDRVPVEVIGLGQGLTAQLSPLEVTVLVTGPQPLIEALTVDSVSVIVDVSRVSAGENVQLTPTTNFRDGTIPNATIQVLPAAIDVRIAAISEATAEATADVFQEE